MLANKLTDLIKVYDDVLDETSCKEVIDFFDAHSQNHQRLDRSTKPNFTQVNFTEVVNNGQCEKPEVELHTKLTQVFMSSIDLYQIDCSITDEMPQQWGIEQIRIKKYNQLTDCCNPEAYQKADQFSEHVDVGDYNSARRYLAMFLYLNDTKQSGRTTFPYLDLHVDPVPGRILMFPPLWMYPHAGLPSYEADKYIVGTYCHYL